MLTKKKYAILGLFILISISSNAQQQNSSTTQKSKFWEKVHFGGGIGLGLANGYTNVSLSPTAIYQFNDQFALGVGLNGTYAKRKNFYTATIFGGSLISLYNPIESFQLSAEFEENIVSYRAIGTDFTRNYSYPSLFLGIGYTIGNFGAVGIRYDVLYDNRSIYGSAFVPFFRVFF